MNTHLAPDKKHSAPLATLLLLGLSLSPATLCAQFVEFRFDGTVVNTNGSTPTILNIGGKAAGYERMYFNSTPDSPFNLPTASQTPVSTTRTYRLLELPVSMVFRVDTRLIPSPLTNTATESHYFNRAWDGSNATPYQPWMTASLTLNGVTRSYVADRISKIALSDNDPSMTAINQFTFDVREALDPGIPLNFNSYISRLTMIAQLQTDLLSGVGLNQNFTFNTNSTPGQSAFQGWFQTYEGTHDLSVPFNGYKPFPDLTEDTGYILVTGFSARSIAPEQLPLTPVPEPSTYALFGAGTLGLLGYLRKRRRAGK